MGHGRPLLRGWLHGAVVPFAVAGSGLLWRAGGALLLRLDGAATVLMISGTFVPVAAYTLDGAWRSWSLAGAMVLTGVGVGLAVTRVATPPRLAAIGYVLAGWLTAIPIWRIALVLPRPRASTPRRRGRSGRFRAAVYALRRPDPSPAWFG